MAQKQTRNRPETASSREKPKRGNRMVEHHVWGFVAGKFLCFSARDRNWRPCSRLLIRLSGLVCLENQNGPEAHMMGQRLRRQLEMAHRHDSNRTGKQEDQQVSPGNGTKDIAPAKKEEKEIVTDGLAALFKAHQQSEGS